MLEIYQAPRTIPGVRTCGCENRSCSSHPPRILNVQLAVSHPDSGTCGNCKLVLHIPILGPAGTANWCCTSRFWDLRELQTGVAHPDPGTRGNCGRRSQNPQPSPWVNDR